MGPFDLNAFASNMGYDTSGPMYQNADQTPADAAQTKAAPGGIGQFLGNLGSSLKNLGYEGVEGLVNAIKEPIQKSQEHIGALFNEGNVEKSQDAIRSSVDASVQDLHTELSQGKISKQEFEQGMSKAEDQYSKLEGENKAQGKRLGNPITSTADVATALAEPTAFAAPEAAAAEGEAAGGAAAGTSLLKAAGSATGAVAKGVVKNALVTNPMTQFAGKTVNDLANKDVGAAAGDAALWAIPSAVKYGVAPLIKGAAKSLGMQLFGKSAIINSIFNPKDVQDFIKQGGDSNTLKQIEQFTLNQPAVGGDVNKAGSFLTQYIQNKIPGIEGGTKGLQQLVDNFKPYAKTALELQDKADAGETVIPDKSWSASQKPISASALVVSHNFKDNVQPVLNQLRDAFTDPRWNAAGGGDLSYRLSAVNAALDRLGLENDTLNRNLGDALLKSDSYDQAEAFLNNAVEDAQKNVVKDLHNGFIYTSAPNETAVMPRAEEVAGNTLAEGKTATGVMGAIGRGVTKIGASPRSVTPGAYQASLESNLGKRLAAAGVKTTPKVLLSILKDKASQVAGAADERMLTNKEITEAVSNNPELRNVSPSVISKAVTGAYKDIPASVSSGGSKITNAAIHASQVPKVGPIMAKYLRAQGQLKFEGGNALTNITSSPFRLVKVPLKASIIAGAHGATTDSLARAFVGASKDVESALRNDDGGKWFQSSQGDSGTVADEIGNSAGGKQVGAGVKNAIVGLVDSAARASGKTAQQIIDEHGDLYNQLQEDVGMIKGYKGNYLNSPLAKSLNLVIFPSRFDTKVVMAAGKIMGRMTPMQQVALVHAAAQFHQFLGSPQGRQWAQQNSTAIQVLSYFSPLETFKGVYDFAANGQHLQDLGQIGGLPFGVITTMITHQVPNLGHLGSSQYFDPSTGQPVPEAFPDTLKASMQQAITDIIGSMFSYPGESVGLQSKTKLIQGTSAAISPSTNLKPASNEVTYRYANGAAEGSAGAPAAQGGQPTNKPNQNPAPRKLLAPLSTSETVKPTTGLTPTIKAGSTRAKKLKSLPASQALPGSSAFAQIQ